jgi:hypothetical protein
MTIDERVTVVSSAAVASLGSVDVAALRPAPPRPSGPARGPTV